MEKLPMILIVAGVAIMVVALLFFPPFPLVGESMAGAGFLVSIAGGLFSRFRGHRPAKW